MKYVPFDGCVIVKFQMEVFEWWQRQKLLQIMEGDAHLESDMRKCIAVATFDRCCCNKSFGNALIHASGPALDIQAAQVGYRCKRYKNLVEIESLPAFILVPNYLRAYYGGRLQKVDYVSWDIADLHKTMTKCMCVARQCQSVARHENDSRSAESWMQYRRSCPSDVF